VAPSELKQETLLSSHLQESGRNAFSGYSERDARCPRVRFAGFGRDADRAQNVNHQACGRGTRCARAVPAVVRTRRDKTSGAMPARFNRDIVLMAVAWDTPSRRAMRRARFACARKRSDEFHIIFEQRGRLSDLVLPKQARLRKLGGEIRRLARFRRLCALVKLRSPHRSSKFPRLSGKVRYLHARVKG